MFDISCLLINNETSIGGLVVKLAVAISQMSASPGFDSRPMHLPKDYSSSRSSFGLSLVSEPYIAASPRSISTEM